MNEQSLCNIALKARENSYAPYSGYRVGAALITSNGKIFTGCNIENAAYSPSVCAERVAFFSAISSGERDFEAIAVAGGNSDEINSSFPPCGVCRQVMAEFCKPDFTVYIVNSKNSFKKFTLSDLLPESFTPENIV